MTTKKTAVPAAEQQPVTIRPDMIEISDRTDLAFSAAAVLVRQGWTFFDQIAPEVFANIGKTTLVLVKGTPGPDAVAIADGAESYATLRAQADYDKAVLVAAARMLEDARQAEVKTALEAEVADSEKALRALKDKLARTA
jgi:hypothetical protein